MSTTTEDNVNTLYAKLMSNASLDNNDKDKFIGYATKTYIEEQETAFYTLKANFENSIDNTTNVHYVNFTTKKSYIFKLKTISEYIMNNNSTSSVQLLSVINAQILTLYNITILIESYIDYQINADNNAIYLVNGPIKFESYKKHIIAECDINYTDFNSVFIYNASDKITFKPSNKFIIKRKDKTILLYLSILQNLPTSATSNTWNDVVISDAAYVEKTILYKNHIEVENSIISDIQNAFIEITSSIEYPNIYGKNIVSANICDGFLEALTTGDIKDLTNNMLTNAIPKLEINKPINFYMPVVLKLNKSSSVTISASEPVFLLIRVRPP